MVGPTASGRGFGLRVLVTGATGFVGAAVMKILRSHDGIDPIGLARSTYSSAPGDIRACGDLDQVEDWGRLLANVNAVLHCAARAHVLREEAVEPLAAFRRSNVEPTLKLARQAAGAGVRRFVFVSSIGVLGRAQEHPFSAMDEAHPEDPYAISKWEAERGLWAVARETGLEVVVVRPPLVYGPGAPGNFGRLLKWVANGVPLPLGSVDNRRSLIGLDNLVDLLVTCLDHPAAANQVFLAGDGEDLSTTELLRSLAAALGRHSRLIPVSPRVLRIGARLVGMSATAGRLLDSLQVDISHTHKTLGWTPPVGVTEGLRRAVAPLIKPHNK